MNFKSDNLGDEPADEMPPPNAIGHCETCGVEIDQWQAMGIVYPKHCEAHEPSMDAKAIEAAKAAETERRRQTVRAVIPPLYQEIGTRFNSKFPRAAWAEISRWEPAPDGFERSHGLIVTGETGLYKSTMVCFHVAKIHITTGLSIGYLSVPEFDTIQRLAWHGTADEKIEARLQLKQARGVRILILDDLGKESPTDAIEKELHSLVEYRLSHLKPTITTLNADAAAYEARLSAERGKPFLRRMMDYNRNVHVASN